MKLTKEESEVLQMVLIKELDNSKGDKLKIVRSLFLKINKIRWR